MNLLDQKDVFLDNIRPFVGMGHYATVAGVNKEMKDLYEKFCNSVGDPPKVLLSANEKRPATSKDTFLSVGFCNVSCAEYWHNDDNTCKAPKNMFVCRHIAKVGVHVLPSSNGPERRDTCGMNKRVLVLLRLQSFEVLKSGPCKCCPWDRRTCCAAAKHGHFDILKWGHENGCKWDIQTCSCAARNGHLRFEKGLVAKWNARWRSKDMHCCSKTWSFQCAEMGEKQWLSMECWDLLWCCTRWTFWKY
ncbi:ankyrin repeat protein [Seminavis robusta]|uniref:Ankyrin repeat protein n=1 Tax=Seminavis robusta TaxID=568900 RepID=A0A9N8HXP4_9STRA|nr:ankyrin repeat protein [Seminavis robusta]|eukprot:Sro3235_g345730.1 ankyrin repeat protein (247) ;mRNA; r:812-1552